MKKTIISTAALLGILVASCGESKPKEPSFQEQMEQAAKESEAESLAADMENVGVGPIKSYTLSESVNQELADKGKALYQEKCTACHKENEKVLGPPPAGVLERRNPAWILNMILNPEEMIKKDPIAKRLMEEYKTPMLNQNLTEDEAKAILEYFRTL